MSPAEAHGRGLFEGINQYIRPLRPWMFHLSLPHPKAVARLRAWRPVGIIASVPDAELERRLLSLRVPMVNCTSDLDSAGVDRVCNDNEKIGAAAAAYFIDRGYTRLAYCGESARLSSRMRATGFADASRAAGIEPIEYVDARAPRLLDTAGWRWPTGNASLRRWVDRLPKPVGLLAAHDPLAMLLGEVCQEIALRVPDEVALLGVDDDAMLCEMMYPTLSSVRIPSVRIGFEAAQKLDTRLHGDQTQPQIRRLPPVGIATRQSSDHRANDDPLVTRAMRFIHQHADEPIQVNDVAAATGVSRRNLETRFQRFLGQTVYARIQRAHVDRAAVLLRAGDQPLERIASASGFNNRETLSRVFRQLIGISPGRFRNGPLTP